MCIILSSAYNAPIQYYSKFLLNKPVFIEVFDTYIKQSYRNRCVIYSPDGALPLSIPVAYSSQERTKTKDVLISEHNNWQHTHWNALLSAYNSTPFFEYYKDDFQKIYNTKFVNLIDFNDQLLQHTLSLLNIDVPLITYSNEYIDRVGGNCLDYREIIHPKINYSTDPLFVSTAYYQVFSDKKGFIPNLSILDLLFNMGNESTLILLASIANKEG